MAPQIKINQLSSGVEDGITWIKLEPKIIPHKRMKLFFQEVLKKGQIYFFNWYKNKKIEPKTNPKNRP